MDGFAFVDDSVCMATLYTRVCGKVVCMLTSEWTCLFPKETHNTYILIPCQVVLELCRIGSKLPVPLEILFGDFHNEYSFCCSACAWGPTPDLCQHLLELLKTRTTHTTKPSHSLQCVVMCMSGLLQGLGNVYTMFGNVYERFA